MEHIREDNKEKVRQRMTNKALLNKHKILPFKKIVEKQTEKLFSYRKLVSNLTENIGTPTTAFAETIPRMTDILNK